MKPKIELADIIRRFGSSFLERFHPDFHQQNVLNAILHCRTAEMGGHKQRCTHCGHEHISYNSCRNRHCPKCQNKERELWIRQIKDMLPKGNYFHVVFTLPDSLNGLFLAFTNEMQDILFHSAWETVRQFAAMPAYLGAQTGMIAVLHTWGQTLVLHPHLHCIVPDSGINANKQWVKGKMVENRSKFLFPVRQMSVVFRGKFLSEMSLFLKEKHHRKSPTIDKKAFNIFAKSPFNGIESVVKYLGRYTHKIAISNYRIKDIDDAGVLFSYKDYRENAKEKLMYLSGEEFLRRFCLHIQGKGFRRIRYFGVFATSNRKLLNEIRTSLGQSSTGKRVKKKWIEVIREVYNRDPTVCPQCKTGIMETIFVYIQSRPPPCQQTEDIEALS
jgi:hypothetical protein